MLATRLVIGLILAGSAASAQAPTPTFVIATVAGTPPAVPLTPAQALSVPIGSPTGLAADTAGNLFFTTAFASAGGNYEVLLRLDQSGILLQIAGGPAAATKLSGIGGVAADSAGNVFITDSMYGRVLRIAADGTITTIAGIYTCCGLSRSSGDGGPAVNASFTYPQPQLIAIDASGNLYVLDNVRIRKISTDGIITTVAGNGIYGYSGDGGPATSAELGYIGGLAVDPKGNLYLSDSYYSGDDDFPTYTRVRMVSPDGTISTIAGNGGFGYSGDGGQAINAQLQLTPGGALATDSSGNLYILGGDRVRKVSTNGIITTIAGTGAFGYSGDGGPATSALLGYASALATDSAGNVYIADGPRIRKVTPAGTITTVAGDGNSTGGAAFGDGGPATAATLSNPTGVAVDNAGTLYIADTFNNDVRKVDSNGVISTIAVGGAPNDYGDGLNWPSGLAIDPGGNLYVADCGNGRIRMISPGGNVSTVAGIKAVHSGFSGDGGPAIAAELSWPKDIALDSSGNLYIADTNNNRIRLVTTGGTITTISGTGVPGYNGAGYSGDGGPAVSANLNLPSGVAIDASGTLFIADTNNFRVRKISPSGIIITVAGTGVKGSSGDGGPALQAQLNNPTGLKLDNAGNLYIADGAAVRMVWPTGVITTVAGTGVLGFSGDGGPATSAQLGAWGLAVDRSGNLYVADPWSNIIRLLAPAGQ
jgi:sugar lactone lactonase YvrE